MRLCRRQKPLCCTFYATWPRWSVPPTYTPHSCPRQRTLTPSARPRCRRPLSRPLKCFSTLTFTCRCWRRRATTGATLGSTSTWWRRSVCWARRSVYISYGGACCSGCSTGIWDNTHRTGREWPALASGRAWSLRTSSRVRGFCTGRAKTMRHTHTDTRTYIHRYTKILPWSHVLCFPLPSTLVTFVHSFQCTQRPCAFGAHAGDADRTRADLLR